MSALNITETWTMDPDHSSVEFSVRHAGISKVKGTFDKVEATATPGDRTHVTVRMETDSLNTKSEGRDAHLKSADFFDVENHPEIAFEGEVSENNETLEGTLTIRGVSRPHSFSIEEVETAVDAFGAERIGVEAKSTLDRTDFGLTWNAALEAGGVLVSNKVAININASFVKAQD